jgi:phospholipid/cholesterol/gamma-HCH transport system substrate-binding protein
MTRQAQVGAFAIVALLFLFGVFYFITDFGTRHTGYQVGIHFQSAAGLTSGALVYFSGVNVGSVDSISLLKDNTVDVILAVKQDIDIPLASRFLIQAPLTGSPSLIIIPPPPGTSSLPLLARQVLPVEQQPQGSNSASIADLLQEGQGEIKRLDVMLSLMEKRTPKLLDTLQTTLNNANDLTTTAKSSMQQVSAQLLSLSATLQTTLTTSSANIEQLTGTLNSAATVDSKKVGALLDQFQDTSTSLNKSMNALESLATDPNLKQSLLTTTASIAKTTQNLALMTGDLRTITGDPNTQAQIRSTIASLDATLQKANSLLGELGGTSDVPGVDPNATPYPPYALPSGGATPYPMPSGSGGSKPPSPYNATGGQSGMTPSARSKLQSKLGDITRNIVQLQVSLYGLSPQHACCLNPTLPSNQGPSGDLNMYILPNYSTSLMLGASSIGNTTTYNAALLQRVAPGVHIGGGVLYSQLGLTGDISPPTSPLGFQGYIYNLRYPSLDLYGNLKIAPGTQLFFGQRDILHASRRNTFGLKHVL